MSRFLVLYRSSIGKKAIVAVTGAVLLAFLVFHVLGNLKVFLPDPEPGVADIDVYSRFLRTMGEPLLPHGGALWLLRGVLLGALALHLLCVIQLALRNRRARPIRYARLEHQESTPPARWMLYSGALILLFVVVHILQFTTGTIDASRFTRGAVYANLYRAFRVWYIAAFYVGMMGVLALHVYHGAWSVFQSLGLDNADRNRGLRRLAAWLALGLLLAFASIPTAFLVGALGAPAGAIAAATGRS